MCAELLANGPPGSVNAFVEESLFDGDQEMIGKDTQKDVRLGPILQVVENGALHQRALHGSEGRLDPRQQNVGAPDFIGRQILTVCLQHIASIELCCNRFFLGVLLPGNTLPLGVVLDLVVACNGGDIAL